MHEGEGGDAPLPDPRRVLVVAGEASGDRHCAGLVDGVRQMAPAIVFAGIGRRAMRASGLEPLLGAAKIAVLWVVDILSSLRILGEAFRRCVTGLTSDSP